MIRLMLWSCQDDAAWLDHCEDAMAKFKAMYALRDRTGMVLHSHLVKMLAEYWFEFETEEEAAIFKLTYM